MTFAFGGLLLSASTAVNQFGFLLTVSVLFDTFVIQSIVVPAVMSFADRGSWWPRRVPTENLITLDDDEFDDDDGEEGEELFHEEEQQTSPGSSPGSSSYIPPSVD